MKNTLLLFLACMALSCANEKKHYQNVALYHYHDFGTPIGLKGEILPLDSIWKPTRIWSKDSSLILAESGDDFLVHVYHKGKGYKTAWNIPYGIGPDERLNCWSLQLNESNVWAFDMQKGMVTSYPSPDFFTKSNITPTRSTLLKGGVTGVACLPDGRLVTSALSDTKNLLSVYDANGNLDTTVRVQYPALKNMILPDNMEKRFFENRIYYQEKSDKIVLFYVYTDLIEIYGSNLQLLARIHGPDQFVPELQVHEVEGKKQASAISNKTKFAFLSGYLTDNEIWVLYYGISPEPGKELQDRIFVYDYTGKPLRAFHLQYPISTFCVDTEGVLYGLSEQPDPCVIKYETVSAFL